MTIKEILRSILIYFFAVTMVTFVVALFVVISERSIDAIYVSTASFFISPSSFFLAKLLE
jgi:hypothetical protein